MNNTKPFINLSQFAKNHLVNICKKNNSQFVMLQSVGGGCAGFKYKWSFINNNEIDPLDTQLDLEENYKLIIDRYSAMNLIGMTIDYVESISGSSLEISNPNAKSTCGCGESFS